MPCTVFRDWLLKKVLKSGPPGSVWGNLCPFVLWSIHEVRHWHWTGSQLWLLFFLKVFDEVEVWAVRRPDKFSQTELFQAWFVKVALYSGSCHAGQGLPQLEAYIVQNVFVSKSAKTDPDFSLLCQTTVGSVLWTFNKAKRKHNFQQINEWFAQGWQNKKLQCSFGHAVLAWVEIWGTFWSSGTSCCHQLSCGSS